jgi:hypothetical protein
MSDKPNATLQTTDGSVRLSPKEITAHGKERSRIVTTWFAGLALVSLIAIYGISLAVGKDAHELLPVMGTVFGIFVGRFMPQGE